MQILAALLLLLAGEPFSKGLAPIESVASPADRAAAACAPCHSREYLATSSPIPPGTRQLLVVMTGGWSATSGTLTAWRRAKGKPWQKAHTPMAVVVGASGLGWGRGLHDTVPGDLGGPKKREGDGRAPAGVFRLGPAFGYRPRPPAGVSLAYRWSHARLVCVDDPASPDYNRFAERPRGRQPAWKHAEPMRLNDDDYRLGLVVQHNQSPVAPRAGSCIFLHIASPPEIPTVGCTAMAAADLERVLRWLEPDANPLLVQLPAVAYDQLAPAWNLPASAAP